jgi:hypothetical protein
MFVNNIFIEVIFFSEFGIVIERNFGAISLLLNEAS